MCIVVESSEILKTPRRRRMMLERCKLRGRGLGCGGVVAAAVAAAAAAGITCSPSADVVG